MVSCFEKIKMMRQRILGVAAPVAAALPGWALKELVEEARVGISVLVLPAQPIKAEGLLTARRSRQCAGAVADEIIGDDNLLFLKGRPLFGRILHNKLQRRSAYESSRVRGEMAPQLIEVNK